MSDKKVKKVAVSVEYDDGTTSQFDMAGQDLDLAVEWQRPPERIEIDALHSILRPGPLSTLIVRVERRELESAGRELDRAIHAVEGPEKG